MSSHSTGNESLTLSLTFSTTSNKKTILPPLNLRFAAADATASVLLTTTMTTTTTIDAAIASHLTVSKLLAGRCVKEANGNLEFKLTTFASYGVGRDDFR